MSKSQEYWSKRLENDAQRAYEDKEKVAKELETVYKRALLQLEADLDSLYFRMLGEGEISPLAIYKYQRNKSLQKQIELVLHQLGVEEEDLIKATLIDSYIEVAVKTNATLGATLDPILMQRMAAKAVEVAWLDGNYSTRLWKNKSKLREKLNKMVIDSLALGKSKDIAVKDLQQCFGVAFSDADRLVRTELMYVINQSQKEMYMEAGYNKYRILAHVDKRTSEICKNENGKEYYFSQIEVGVNYPPFHPRCRTTVVPVLN